MTQHTDLIERLRASSEDGLTPDDAYAAAEALEAQAREIAKIEQENDLLRQHAAKQISDATLLTGIDVSNGAMNMGLQGGAAQLLAESFFDQFQKSEAVNYLELRFESESKMPGKAMVVTLQLVGGITPGEMPRPPWMKPSARFSSNRPAQAMDVDPEDFYGIADAIHHALEMLDGHEDAGTDWSQLDPKCSRRLRQALMAAWVLEYPKEAEALGVKLPYPPPTTA